MPTTYAHWRFGELSLRHLERTVQETVLQYRDLFDIGVHGPDIFFYYKCLKPNEVNTFGSQLHYKSMKQILETFRKNWLVSDHKDAGLAYMLGFLAHFTLDSQAHGYVDRKAEAEGPSHNKIESQFDRYLLEKDGHDPITFRPADTLKPSKFNAAVMHQLFGCYSTDVFLKTVKDQRFYLNLLKDSSKAKRAFLTAGMKALHLNKYIDLMMTGKNEENCICSNLRLEKLFDIGLRKYPQLAENMIGWLNGKEELLPYFDNTFEKKPDYQSIPLLSLEEEKKYQPADQE